MGITSCRIGWVFQISNREASRLDDGSCVNGCLDGVMLLLKNSPGLANEF